MVSLWQRERSAGCLQQADWRENKPAARGRTTNIPMPLYEYVCRKCHKKFGEVLTIKEHDTKKLHCPKCQSTDLEKVIEPFFAKTTSKTGGY
jgi:putative FmdB family regulatory protein